MNKVVFSFLALSLLLLPFRLLEAQQIDSDTRPNIVLILVDDLGYGDVGVFNPESKIPTPNLDALASQGMRFTDAHTPAAVCTPSRYGVITGRYPWRGSWRKGVVKGDWFPGNVPALIEQNSRTLPDVLRAAGYHTALVGKWHLGGTEHDDRGQRVGVLAAGFEEDLVFREADGTPESRVTYFREYDARVTDRAVAWLEEQAAEGGQRPFFLEICPRNPHDPWIALKEFSGKSDVGSYGDVVMQLDAQVGAIVATLDRLDFANNTLLVLTSDNGPESARRDYSKPPFEIPADADDRIHITDRLRHFHHDSTGGYRGAKYSAYDAGHRVPFIVRWPGIIPENTVSDRLFSLTDLFATFASAASVSIPVGAAEDSIDQMSVFRNPAAKAQRVDGIFASGGVHTVSVRSGSWALIDRERSWFSEFIEGPDWELYDLATDPSQQTDQARKKHGIAAEVRNRRKEIESHGHRLLDE